MGPRERIADQFREHRRWFEMLGSPLYAALAGGVVEDVEAGGPAWDLLGPYARAEPGGAFLPVRLMGAVHRLVLEGRLPDLAAHYPSAGGTGDAEGAWEPFRAALSARAGEIRALLDRPIQTNDVARSCALLGGFLTVARRFGLPLRLLEVGAAAGLNLRWDRYRMQYLGDAGRARLRATIEVAVARATEPAPLAWLRFEPDDVGAGVGEFRVDLTTWPGDEARKLATALPHGTPVVWTAE